MTTKRQKQTVDPRLIWIALGFMSVCVTIIAGNFPDWVEKWYSRGIYLGFRWGFDWILGWSPVSVLLLQIIILLFVLYRFFRALRSKSWAGRFYHFSLSSMAFIGGFVFFFQLFWGYNYKRIPVEQQLGLEIENLDSARLEWAFRMTTEKVKELRSQIMASDTFPIVDVPENMEEIIRGDAQKVFKKLGFPSRIYPQARQLWPQGILLRFSTSGFYFPFSGECNLDRGLHPLQKPYVMAHEFAHAFGIGDEGSCNFLAFLFTTESDDLLIQYNGWFTYWRQLARSYRTAFPSKYKEMYASLPPGIKNDWIDIVRQMRRFPDFMPAIRDVAYHNYLRSQGVKEGIKSYGRVILLVDAYMRETVNGER